MKKFKLKALAAGVIALLSGYSQQALACPVAPAEVLHRPLLLSPMLVPANSESSQFVGRTTLASGSATVTVSTTNVTSDSIIPLTVQAALAAAYGTQGIIEVVSGGATGVASTTAVYSGQHIDVSYLNASDQSSGQGRGFRVNSIVDGTSFAIATDDGKGVIGTAQVMWRIPQAIPQGVKVNTISPGNFFTLGWADQKARPVDATVMWEIKKAAA